MPTLHFRCFLPERFLTCVFVRPSGASYCGSPRAALRLSCFESFRGPVPSTRFVVLSRVFFLSPIRFCELDLTLRLQTTTVSDPSRILTPTSSSFASPSTLPIRWITSRRRCACFPLTQQWRVVTDVNCSYLYAVDSFHCCPQILARLLAIAAERTNLQPTN